ncbi:Mg-chelatase subunit ChlD [uncultured Roseburia sp.]|uniref:VWA domain-containing protein n=1 Tax=Brotonthovivens ammoniilytica TaxID=2981725 RepID=A0ABT2TFY5_9FIRM|nr:vWA domain-containing protein [Brotonthovivens ammoniilytica]MCU6761098.1 VWA domain-containing protein [Brotonthovivens ammoniilytica]SCI18788.1 Mg-chelatase subunit ChlD [uncultured Roseburia sp.]
MGKKKRKVSAFTKGLAVLMILLLLPGLSASASGASDTTADNTAGESTDSQNTAVPKHHKYIRYNDDDSYTLTLDVTGVSESETSKSKLDVLLIVDQSKSMGTSMGSRGSRLDVLKEIITGKNSLSGAILENENIDGRMAIVSYSGSAGRGDTSWNDASTVLNWTDQKSDLDAKLKRIYAEGGTNCQAGLYEGQKVLKSARSDAQKVVIFLSDGEPTYYYDKNGKTQGSGNFDEGGKSASAAYSQAKKMTDLSGFYTVGISKKSDTEFLKKLVKQVNAREKGTYHADTAAKLTKIFEDITADITEYTCRNVTITDTLSEYVELDDEDPAYSVTAVDSQGRDVDLSEVDVEFSYDSSARTVTVQFPKDFVLDADVTYSIHFNIHPSQKAFDEFADKGYSATGSANSDASGNSTSSGKKGFFSNTSAELTYTYGTSENARSYTAEYEEKPVIQVSVQDKNASLTISKEVRGEMGDKKKTFSFTIRLKDKNKNPVSGEGTGIQAAVYACEGGILPGVTGVEAPEQSSVEFEKDGTAVVSLKHGQTLTIKNLPDGYFFEVTENAEGNTGYTVTYNGEQSDCASGILDGDQTAAVVNQKEYVPDTGIVDGTAGDGILPAAGILAAGAVCGLMLRRRMKH